ncbi:hypothetical protein NP493_246g01069 [Ridgeia piscesae]|uniref:Uncharacterized protein n=1 Tax=Ridgeia piscesae TaxID=27915 RepID=A0AAD9NZ03_RIDPI|nr:hypothetical protein NP493_246g01069 [Ridgeia piscesae]
MAPDTVCRSPVTEAHFTAETTIQLYQVDTCPENNNKHQNGFVARDDVKQQPDHVSGGEVTEGVRTRKVREDIRIREVTEQVQVKEEQDPVQKPQRQRASASTERSVPKAVVFDVPLEDTDETDIIRRHPPKRLQRLEPLERAPQVTAEILEEKLRHAEQKRLQELERVKATSRKASRVQRDILIAKQFEEEQQRKKELDEKLRITERNREAKLKEIEEKKQLREERAERNRARARRLQEVGTQLDFEIEKDETFNEDSDDDSWLNAEPTDLVTPSNGDEAGDKEKLEREKSDWEKPRERSDLSGGERGSDPWQRSELHREVGK